MFLYVPFHKLVPAGNNAFYELLYAKGLLFLRGRCRKDAYDIGILHTFGKGFRGKAAAPVRAEIIGSSVTVTYDGNSAVGQFAA